MALGDEAIADAAQEAGMEPEHASSGLARLLPEIVNKLTPEGQVPDNSVVQQGLNLLKSRFHL